MKNNNWCFNHNAAIKNGLVASVLLKTTLALERNLQHWALFFGSPTVADQIAEEVSPLASSSEKW